MAFSTTVQLLWAFALTVVLRAGPEAPPAPRPSPEAELDAQLAAATAKSPPAEVAVVVVGPDAKLYRLEEATVQLDGLPFGAGRADAGASAAVVVSDGDHVVSARLVYRGQAFGPLPWEEGPKWTLPARVSIQATRGLRFTVRLTVETNPNAPPGQRLSLRSDVEPEMLMPLDDAPLPPPPVAHLPPPLPPVPEPAPVATIPTAAISPPATTKKKKKKATRPAAAAAAAKAPSTASPSVGSSDALEEATARLRSALASPLDGGAAAVPASH